MNNNTDKTHKAQTESTILIGIIIKGTVVYITLGIGSTVLEEDDEFCWKLDRAHGSWRELSEPGCGGGEAPGSPGGWLAPPRGDRWEVGL